MSYTRSKSVRRKRPSQPSPSRAGDLRRSSATGRRSPAERVEYTPSSGNVFRDLGFSPHESETLRLRSELMIRIGRLIRRRRLTQARAAKLLGVTQPRISDLIRGKISLFSVDALIEMLHRAGMHVRITVRPKAA